jgi:hypothetical protein
MLAARRVTQELREGYVISLHSYDKLTSVGALCFNYVAVDEAEWWIAILIQRNLVI